MKKISAQEYEKITSINPDIGYYYCAEGVPARNNAPSIIGFMNGDIYLCMPEEIGSKEWDVLMERQVQELISFLDKEDA